MKIKQIYKNPIKNQTAITGWVCKDGEVTLSSLPCYLVGIVELDSGETEVMPLAWDSGLRSHIPYFELSNQLCSSECFLGIIEEGDVTRDELIKRATRILMERCPQRFDQQTQCTEKEI